MSKKDKNIIWFENLDSNDVPNVGGKNASLGEMIGSLKKEGIDIPDGFATTSSAYRKFLQESDIEPDIRSNIDDLHHDKAKLEKVGKSIRELFLHNDFPEQVEKEIRERYSDLCSKYDSKKIDVAVRSSATAEDLPGASFAGQQETFLNISGEDDLLQACKKCYASLFTDRAISYREEKGFDHMKVALSIGVQKMVRSDLSGSGVMFSIDTETGFRDVVVINATWGLGENVVQGTVNPDEYRVFKPILDDKNKVPIIEKKLGDKEKKMIYAKGGSKTTKNVDTTKTERKNYVLTDNEILKLARWAAVIENHYDKPMDMEWAKDGETDELFIVQARPETVQSQKQASTMKTYQLEEKGKELLTGLAIGEAIASGKVQIIKSTDEMDKFEKDSILVTGMTDPDWVPIMKQAAGIITDYGGRTSHAAIVSRELGIPAVVGSEEGTDVLEDDQKITLSCAEGEKGHIYEGELKYKSSELDLKDIPDTKTQIMMNIASPDAAFRWWRLPAKGIGLARMEFIINNVIKIHPMALLKFDGIEDKKTKKTIQKMTTGYKNLPDYFVDHLARGIAKIAASQYPNPVVVRMSDFKTNEYADLIGGEPFEPKEDNPMIGFRGASRYYHDKYREGFGLECKAIKKVREEMGLKNVIVMIPFCRTLDEADKVLEVMADHGLKQSNKKEGLKVYVMCEIPSNVILAKQFAKRFDGFSIGTNDLTQLVLGIDRDSADLTDLFDERNEAVKEMIRDLLKAAHDQDRKVGICGQAPSDYPEFAEFLVKEGIDSISLNPDSVIQVKKIAGKIEK
jgi:pyruvate,water dikinase